MDLEALKIIKEVFQIRIEIAIYGKSSMPVNY